MTFGKKDGILVALSRAGGEDQARGDLVGKGGQVVIDLPEEWYLPREEATVPHSVLDAIKMGIWDFEPEAQSSTDYEPTTAMPGSAEKVEVLSRRLRMGQPLWHPEDRLTYDGKPYRVD